MNPKVYLAPMSGVTDLPFRLISRKLGAKHCFFEMLNVKPLVYGNVKNKRFLQTLKKDSPISAQLIGTDPDLFLEAAKKLISLVNISSLDINSACPVKKITKKSAGAALLEDLPRLGKIIKKLASNLRIPVTVKLRAGFNSIDIKKCVKTAKLCQTNGASTIFIHGRTMAQGYYGDINYESIKAVKEAVKIPVFGSGNIFGPLMAKKMLDKTGCDGILVARGALGNPWIFKNIQNFLLTGATSKEPTLPERKKILKQHLELIKKYKNVTPNTKLGFMGKIAIWYLKGVYKTGELRRQMHQVKSYPELINLIGQINERSY